VPLVQSDEVYVLDFDDSVSRYFSTARHAVSVDLAPHTPVAHVDFTPGAVMSHESGRGVISAR
jgi:hypothetical protein